MNTAGRFTVPPSPGGWAIESDSVKPKAESSSSLKYWPQPTAIARHRHAVLEDQVPADDPRDELAERGVGVRVRAAGDRDRRRKLGVRESREGARHPREHEREQDRRARLGDRLADDHEDPGADDGSEPERRQVEKPDHAT
jgi:hypothetical protein